MTPGLWIVCGGAALIAAIGAEAYFKRNKRRSLAKSQPDRFYSRDIERKPGFEAADISGIEQTHQENRLKENRNWRKSLGKLFR